MNVRQVKEKFGSLRFYVHHPEPLTDEGFMNKGKLGEYITVIGDLSRRTCEICGDHGKIYAKNGFYQALCTKHQKEKS